MSDLYEINGKTYEYSELDNTMIDEGGNRWSAYDMVTFLRSDQYDWASDEDPKPRSYTLDVINMDIEEDYDEDNFDIVGLSEVDESQMLDQTASLDDDGLFRYDR